MKSFRPRAAGAPTTCVRVNGEKENPMTQVIRLPNQKLCSLSAYARAWKAIKNLPPATSVFGWACWPVQAGEVLEVLRFGLHDRINRHVEWHGKGRKWGEGYQVEFRRAGRAVNTPRLILDWLPADLRDRFGHRLRKYEFETV